MSDDHNNDDKPAPLMVAVASSVVAGFLILSQQALAWSNGLYQAQKDEEAASAQAEKKAEERELINSQARAIHFGEWSMELAKDMPAHDDPVKLYDLTLTGAIEAEPKSNMLSDGMQAAGTIVKNALADARFQVMGNVEVENGAYHMERYETAITVHARVEGREIEVAEHVDAIFSKLKEDYAAKAPSSLVHEMNPQDTVLANTGKDPAAVTR